MMASCSFWKEPSLLVVPPTPVFSGEEKRVANKEGTWIWTAYRFSLSDSDGHANSRARWDSGAERKSERDAKKSPDNRGTG